MDRIRQLIISPEQEDHIWAKHRVTAEEVDETCASPSFVLRGRAGSFALYGQTDAGRYLVIFLYPRGRGVFSVATARDLTPTERRRVQNQRGR
jgi:hypothetical protein